MNKIEHPGILQIFDYGQQENGCAYIAMELLKGETLTARLARGPAVRPLGEALRIMWQLASALAAAHSAGIVHRDLKPDNIMLIPDADAPGGERAKLLDFGIAKLVEGVRGDQPKTQSQIVMGTPQYMSPEQCKAARLVDDKTDVYALGTILFELLAGRTPFVSETSGEYIGMHLFKQPPRLSELAPAVPPDIAALVDSTLLKDQKQRPSMAQVVASLAQFVRRFSSPSFESEQQLALASRSGSPTIRVGGFTSTLGRSLGQLTQRGAVSRWRFLGIAAALLAIGGAGVAIRQTSQSGAKAGAEAVRQPTSGPVSVAVPVSAPPPQPRSVHWTIRTTPPGASVIDSDGKVLGRTPWEQSAPAAAGTRSLSLRLTGYAEQTLTLDRARDVERQERLVRQSTGSGTSESRPSHAPQKRAPDKKIPDKIEYIE